MLQWTSIGEVEKPGRSTKRRGEVRTIWFHCGVSMDFMVIDKTRGRTKREHQRIDIHYTSPSESSRHFISSPTFYYLFRCRTPVERTDLCWSAGSLFSTPTITSINRTYRQTKSLLSTLNFCPSLSIKSTESVCRQAQT